MTETRLIARRCQGGIDKSYPLAASFSQSHFPSRRSAGVIAQSEDNMNEHDCSGLVPGGRVELPSLSPEPDFESVGLPHLYPTHPSLFYKIRNLSGSIRDLKNRFLRVRTDRYGTNYGTIREDHVGSSDGMAPFLLVLVVHKIRHCHLISIDSREGKVCRAWCTDILERGFVEILRFPDHRRIGRFIGDSDDIGDACLASLYQRKGNMLVFRYIAMQRDFTARHGGKSTFWNPFKRNGKDTSVVRYRHLSFDHSSHSRLFPGVFKG